MKGEKEETVGGSGRLRPAGRSPEAAASRQPPKQWSQEIRRRCSASSDLTSKLGVGAPPCGTPEPGAASTRRGQHISPLRLEGAPVPGHGRACFGERVGEECYLHHELACGPMQGIPGLRPPLQGSKKPVDPLLGQPDPAPSSRGELLGTGRPYFSQSALSSPEGPMPCWHLSLS